MLIFIAEPMINFAQVPSWFWPSIGVSKYCINNRGPLLPNIWALWGSDLLATIVYVSDQCIALELAGYQSPIYIDVVYANNYYVKRHQLWADLTHMQGCFQGPWIFIGDFNAVLGAHEKRGTRPPPILSCTYFLNWTNANILHHLPTLGVFFTWTNGRFGEENVTLRLDREVCNEEWVNFWCNSACTALVRHQSDHNPLLLSVLVSSVIHAIPLKFYKMWTSHIDCHKLVLENWSKGVRGHDMAKVQAKLRNVKNDFKVWNRSVFGDVDRQVKLAKDEVNRIHHLIDSEGFSDQLYMQDLEAHLVLTKALNYQEQLWKEKVRDQNFVHGDRNTTYFHRVSKIQAVTKTISFLQDGDNVITDPTAIELHILSYFQAIFSMDNNCAQNSLIDEIIPSLVSDDDNQMLLRLPLSGEIKDVVFSLNGDGVPGPEGFGGHFTKLFGTLLGLIWLTRFRNFSGKVGCPLIFILILKVQGAKSMGYYRPIALANFQFKIVTKIVADRLAIITSRIISIEQRGFIRDRNIADCVILASEAINSLDKKQYGGNLAIKVDISKAFDTLDWNFLVMVLNNFGFLNVLINWILVILNYVRLSILVNGKAIVFFSCSHGVRQGDPLSPLLLCIAEEVLSRALFDSSARGRLIPILLSGDYFSDTYFVC